MASHFSNLIIFAALCIIVCVANSGEPSEVDYGAADPGGHETEMQKERRERGGVLSTATVYAEVNKQRPPEYWDYHNYEMTYGKEDNYELKDKVGRGKYSKVYEAHDLVNNDTCIVKKLKSIKPQRIQREVKILKELSGGTNIIGLKDTYYNEESDRSALIFEHVSNEDFKTLFPKLSLHGIKFYMHEVLKGLEYAHSNGVMHRDIKPHNIVVDLDNRKLRLIDWGLAEFYHPNKEYNVRVASRNYKAPELLVDLHDYDYSMDIWSLGCIFANLIFKHDPEEPFFDGDDNDDQLVKIAKVLGTKGLFEYTKKYGLELEKELIDLVGTHPRVEWKDFINDENKDIAVPEGIDLLDRMLVYDHQNRITAKEAMEHPFFSAIREEESQKQKESAN